MRRLFANFSFFAFGVLIAIALFLPSYVQAGTGVLTGQTNGISSGRFSPGAGNPSTTYSVGETTIRDITATGTDVTLSRQTPFTAKNRFGDKAVGRIIDAVKVESPALRSSMFGFVKGGLMNVGLTILAGYAIEKGWEWMASAQCQVTPECYVKSQFAEVPFSPTHDTKACLSGTSQCFTIPNANLTSTNTYPSVLAKTKELCQSAGLIFKNVNNYCYTSGFNARYIQYSAIARPAGSTVKREQTAVSDPEIDAFTADVTTNHPADAVRDYTNTSKSVPYAEVPDSKRLESPMETTPRQLTTSTVQNPDGSVDTNTSTGKTVITISPTGDITMTDVTTGTSTHTTPDGVTTTGPTTTSETANESPEEGEPEKPDPLPVEGDWTVPDLYQKKEATLRSTWDEFNRGLSNTPLMRAVSTFFNVNISGYCPNWDIPSFSVGFAQLGPWPVTVQCSSMFINILRIMGGVVLFGCTYIAFKVGISK